VGPWGGAGQEDRWWGSPNPRRVGRGAVGWHDAVAVNGGGAGTMVADDGALALHHVEGESEVRWGRD
jgi:hypothetical protein